MNTLYISIYTSFLDIIIKKLTNYKIILVLNNSTLDNKLITVSSESTFENVPSFFLQ